MLGLQGMPPGEDPPGFLERWLALTPEGLVRFGLTLLLVIAILAGARRLVEGRLAAGHGHALRGQLVLTALALLGTIAVLLALPIEDDHKGQLLSLLGLLLSAAVALASTTLLGNMLAGLMLGTIRGLRVGGFVRSGDHFGRVTERGLLYTQIQTEVRDLVTLPNVYLATHPLTTVRRSGTILTARVSIGYDVPRKRVRDALKSAAAEVGLEDPFVHVLELGDFSVTYRVGGLLAEVKEMITTRMRLRARMLDALHDAGIEIVSPTFMNTRSLGTADRVVPPRAPEAEPEDEERSVLEALAFDKAELAASIGALEQELEALRDERDELQKRLGVQEDEAVKDALSDELERLDGRTERLERRVTARKAYMERSEEDDA